MMYVNPYIRGEKAQEMSRGYGKPGDLLAIEFDIAGVYSDYGIKMHPLVWYGYQRSDLLRMILGTNFQGVDLPELDKEVHQLREKEEIVIDDETVEQLDKDHAVIATQIGEHVVIKRRGDWFIISYPDMEEFSGWGIFVLNENKEWDLIDTEEGVTLESGTQLRFGPAINLKL